MAVAKRQRRQEPRDTGERRVGGAEWEPEVTPAAPWLAWATQGGLRARRKTWGEPKLSLLGAVRVGGLRRFLGSVSPQRKSAATDGQLSFSRQAKENTPRGARAGRPRRRGEKREQAKGEGCWLRRRFSRRASHLRPACAPFWGALRLFVV